MTEFAQIETSEMKVFARRDEHWTNWVNTATECQTSDRYKVKELAASGFKPTKIVDIGAQTGMFTSMAAKYWPDAFIYAFEPVTEWFQVLALNCNRNCMPINACVLGHLDAVGSRAIDYTNGDEIKWRTSMPGYAHRGISVGAMLSIVGQIDLLKIDCEGSEVNILRDMDGRGALAGIQWIVGEYHFAPAKQEVARILGQTHHLEMIEDNNIDFFYAHK